MADLVKLGVVVFGDSVPADENGEADGVAPVVPAPEVGFKWGKVDESERSVQRPVALRMLHKGVREFDGFNGEQPVACGGRSAG